MKNLLTLLIFSLLILTGCGGLKKEINRLTEESKTKTESYEKKISELNTKISETETSETKTKTELDQKISEIATLKKERKELQEQLDKSERSNFDVLNPKGPVKVTDTKSGMSYEFEAGDGTRITNATESVLSTKLNSVTESLSKSTSRNSQLTKTIASQENSIKQKNTQITEQKNELTKLSAKVKTLNEQLAKSVLKKDIKWYIWTLLGMFLLAGGQLLWKIYKPKTPKLL